jgi:hypothetical protein
MTDTIPIMSKYQERGMAFHGLVQWTRSVIWQCQRILDAEHQFRDLFDSPDFDHRANGDAVRCDHHYFAIAANKLIEYRCWVQRLDLCKDIDFREIDSFPKQDIIDVRNMREHVVDYFQGAGHSQSRWFIETPNFQADASSCSGTLIGGRLDYMKFAEAARRLLPALLGLPVPYPPRDV